jgi:hypothetical protein
MSAARMPMMAMTVRSSMMLNPALPILLIRTLLPFQTP